MLKHQITRLIAVLFVLTMLSTTAYATDTDYMAQMEVAVMSGDITTGKIAETSRNDKIDTQQLEVPKIFFNDLYLLSKIIYAEAGSEWLSDEWKMCVGEIVLNRVASPEFPNTIPEVLFQKGQYYGANSSYFKNLKPSANCVNIAKRLLTGERVINNTSVVFQANFKQGGGVHKALHDKHLGWTYFCYSNYPKLYEDV